MSNSTALTRTQFSVKKQTLAAAAAIIAAVALPQIFHAMGYISGLGTSLGETFLPMHLPILIVGLIAGPYAGAAAGLLSPLISYGLTGMPSSVMLPFMMIELCAYGLFSGLLRNTKLPCIAKVVITQICSRECYEVARKYNKPVIIMEPVKGGMLATPPQSVTDILKNAEPDMSPASWAVRFAANLEGVITVLSGMSNIEQMKDNLSYMSSFNGLTDSEKETLAMAQEALNKIPLIPCTSCNYCAKVCPMNIGISGSFTAMNYLTLYSNKDIALGQEGWLVGGHGKKRANECIKCGKCEKACPQHIKIREELEKVSNALIR